MATRPSSIPRPSLRQPKECAPEKGVVASRPSVAISSAFLSPPAAKSPSVMAAAVSSSLALNHTPTRLSMVMSNGPLSATSAPAASTSYSLALPSAASTRPRSLRSRLLGGRKSGLSAFPSSSPAASSFSSSIAPHTGRVPNRRRSSLGGISADHFVHGHASAIPRLAEPGLARRDDPTPPQVRPDPQQAPQQASQPTPPPAPQPTSRQVPQQTPRRAPNPRASLLPQRSAKAAANAAISAGSGSGHSFAAKTNPMDVSLPLSAAELTRLTSKHTRRNEVYVSQLDVHTIRVDGPRPPSPTSKIRKREDALATPKERAANERALRARKRSRGEVEEQEGQEAENGGGGGGENAGIDPPESLPAPTSTPGTHRLGAGDEEVYETPPGRRARASAEPLSPRPSEGVPADMSAEAGAGRQPKQRRIKAVRWDKNLFAEPSQRDLFDPATAKGQAQGEEIKGCMIKPAAGLDRFGNLPETELARSPKLSRTKVTIKKYVYDND